MKENSVEKSIREVANNPISGKLNLVQFKKEKAKAMTHKDVCEKVINYADGNPYMPIYAILSTGVASNAFKKEAFNKGYRSFNQEKVNAVFKMAQAYNEKMNIKGQPSDVTWRLVAKFYDKVSTNFEDFEKSLAKAKVVENAGGRGQYKALCENLGIK